MVKIDIEMDPTLSAHKKHPLSHLHGQLMGLSMKSVTIKALGLVLEGLLSQCMRAYANMKSNPKSVEQ